MSEDVIVWDKDDKWTTTSLELDRKVHELLKPLMLEYAEKGHSLRAVSHVMMHTVFSLECETLVILRKKAREEKG